MRVDLVWLADRPGGPPPWALGEVHVAGPGPADLARVLDRARDADAVACWAASMGTPLETTVEAVLRQPDDVFHSGLRLGRAGLPRIAEAIDPVWMLGLDADSGLESTSWRVALEACVVRTSVLDRLGSIDPLFASLAGAGLEAGHRWISSGARVRHVPDLAPAPGRVSVHLPARDEARFAILRYGRPWAVWGAATAPTSARRRVAVTVAVARALGDCTLAPRPEVTPESRPGPAADDAVGPPGATVSVVIPTIDRGPYLRRVLDQLRAQTVPAHQVLIVDQTPVERRDADLVADFADLPLRLTHLDRPGQCTARNTALAQATGTHLLFLDDDDDDIPSDLIERHLGAIARHDVDAVCGVAEEDGAGALPAAFTVQRVSDVFPTNNTLLRRDALTATGGFDPAYDRGDRADHDLGTRLHLAGARLWLEPSLRVRHRHAPRGGLRTHRARTTTFARRRSSVVHRQELSATQVYLWMRYYSPGRVRRAEAISVLSQLRRPGTAPAAVARLVTQTLLLPNTVHRARRSHRRGAALLGTASGPTPVPEAAAPAPAAR